MNHIAIINPFENDIVSEPRQVEEQAVSGLNEKNLDRLLSRFKLLQEGEIPRKSKLPHAQFVISPQAGYGKSHLIGRLFRIISGKATLVYVRPFENASTCWKSILLKTVQELNFPDDVNYECTSEEKPSQLEVFAHGVMVSLITEAVKAGHIFPKNKNFTNILQNLTIKDLKKSHGFLKKMFCLIPKLADQVNQKGIRLYASPVSWLYVLFTSVYINNVKLRDACEAWLLGSSLDRDMALDIGIRNRDVPGFDMGNREAGEICKHRILDFCKLAGFFRPFIFSFDQTENYGKDRTLAKALGSVIQVLVDESCNQMTVITANHTPWNHRIKEHWEEAFLNRLSLPMELEGLTRPQGMELIEFRSCSFNRKAHDRLIGNQHWLEELFKVRAEVGVRYFLQKCSRQWDIVMGENSPSRNIDTYYLNSVEIVSTRSKNILFDPNTFYWLVHEVARVNPDVSIEKLGHDNAYFSLFWTMEGRKIYFGLESGSHWKRWQAVQRQSEIIQQNNKDAKTVFFRTPELKEIPGKGWQTAPEFLKAEQSHLHIIRLDRQQAAKIYGAYYLYLKAAEGNLPLTTQEVVAFVYEKLMWLWKMVTSPIPCDHA
ncbi:hypothetical protein SAMN02746065_106164 [Desulfocicer vacuolatum DSM 3385]|uniref:Uncharacterized protein n=1 Tax=Desulfocicer vacuolatum DSM 3385 TaxID=1121400 RepID=A0A1W2AYQ8_9BACT|nr:hypothetical protein [Desulfocicer vacuolatum]SMC65849.1 hypothetical protein SAMN02746065_106164 [Desulfocicer vacuolatum DSM 3385]